MFQDFLWFWFETKEKGELTTVKRSVVAEKEQRIDLIHSGFKALEICWSLENVTE